MNPEPTPELLPQPPAKRTSKRWTAVALTSGAVVVAAGLGIAGYAQADPTPSPSAPTAAPSGQPGDPGRGGPGGGPGRHGDRGAFMGDLAKQLAEKLGIDQTKVETALKEIREANRPAKPSTAPSASPSAKPSAPTTPPTRPDPSARDAELAKALAAKLNVSEAKVKTALDEIRAAHAADRAKALKTKLDAAVKAGTLTQAEADAVTKAVEKGVINVGPR